MEKNNNIELENNQNVTADVEENGAKKITVTSIITAIVIVLILAAFAGIVYYNKTVLPGKKIDEAIGYKPEQYIKPGKVDGFEYELTQEMFDEYVSEYNSWHESVKRPAKETDEVDFSYTAMVNGEKDNNISGKDAVLTIGEDIEGIYKKFSDALIGLKKSETAEVTVTGEEASMLSENGTEYTDDVVFQLKVTGVNELVVEEMSDTWVVENLGEDYGFENLKDFYDSIEESLMVDAELALWNQAIEASVMSGWPESLYDEIYVEFIQNANYNADFWGMETMDYLYTVEGYTDETLEEAYLEEVKAEMLMWYLVKEWKLEATEEEVEAQYEAYLWELEDYETVEEMKQDYSYDEIEESVLLDKVHDYIAENSTIKKSYTVPGK